LNNTISEKEENEEDQDQEEMILVAGSKDSRE